ncbi:MAG: MotA/TolQ/ExbB proton channel family protein [Hydrocarboniphaga sp.]|uniref:MotA/TolQ/ExbB proton channel family protein n=1 Tax=Hydrocarboniphaga sp. TaxID=2033016 RepID=UPI002629252B|nr:MotA/TolQ/ExbB proton channel family protein [Hydrocarboniphaga sp.]MDB5971775.1 MotA/TolQ/ExbB proton channel family protein [Hydrocarboniphaga sp.]
MNETLLLPVHMLGDFLDSGGWVVGWILITALVMWTLVLERAWYLWKIHPGRRAAALAEWRARSERESWAALRIRAAMVSQLRIGLESGLALIRVTVPMAPLLGLLGTVTGMLQVFDAMTSSRNTDTRAMADGISHAMIATMAGLVVSLIGLFFTHLFTSRVKRETARLNDLLDARLEVLR